MSVRRRARCAPSPTSMSSRLRRPSIVARPDQSATMRRRPKRCFHSSRSSSTCGYRPTLALTRNGRPLTRPTWASRSVERNSRATASSTSDGMPCVRPKKLKVPCGRMPSRTSSASAAAATALIVPSPPHATITPPSWRTRCAALRAASGMRRPSSTTSNAQRCPALSSRASIRARTTAASLRPEPAFITIT